MSQAFPHGRQERVKVREGWEGRWGRGGTGIGGGKHPFDNHISQAMKFLKLGAHQVHFKETCYGELSVTQSRYL